MEANTVLVPTAVIRKQNLAASLITNLLGLKFDLLLPPRNGGILLRQRPGIRNIYEGFTTSPPTAHEAFAQAESTNADMNDPRPRCQRQAGTARAGNSAPATPP